MNTLHGFRRENLSRSLRAFGRRLQEEDWGVTWVLDGQVWLIDRLTATLLGDYLEYCDAVRSGMRPIVRLPDGEITVTTCEETR